MLWRPLRRRRYIFKPPGGRRYAPRPVRRLSGGQRLALRFIALVIVILVLAGYWTLRLNELVEEAAYWNISTRVGYLINEAIQEKLAEGNLDYSQFITLEKGEGGNVTALITNMVTANKLQSELINRIIEKVDEESQTDLSIPLGNITGGALFLGRGPRIPVRIITLSNYQAEFVNDFSAAGINQTRHRIYLDVTVDLEFLLAGSLKIATVNTELIVAETVIVGEVPDNYTYFGYGEYSPTESYYLTK